MKIELVWIRNRMVMVPCLNPYSNGMKIEQNRNGYWANELAGS